MPSLVLTLLLPVLLYSAASGLFAVFLPVGAVEATALGAIACAPVLYYGYRALLKVSGRRFGHKDVLRVAGIPWGYVVLLGAGACVAINNLINLSGLAGLFPSYGEVSQALYAPSVPVQLLCTGIAIPAAEELVFRGLGFYSLRCRFSFWPSALLSALLFGVYHGNAVQGIYAFLLGLLMAWLLESTESILAPYVFHVAANFVSIAITNSGLMILTDTHQGFLFMAVTAAAAAILLLSLYKIRLKTNYKEEEQL